MDKFVQKKYVLHKVKRTFYKSNVTISQIVVNSIANELYKEFKKCSEKEQEYLLDSDEIVKLLWDKHMATKETELLKEIWFYSCLFFSGNYHQKSLRFFQYFKVKMNIVLHSYHNVLQCECKEVIENG